MPSSRKSFNTRASTKRKLNVEENPKRKRRQVRKIKQTVPKARKQVKRKLKRSRKKQVRRKLKRTRKKIKTLVKRKKVTKHGNAKKPQIKEPEFQGNTKLMCKKTSKKEVQLQGLAPKKGKNLKTNLWKLGTEMRKVLREEKMKNKIWLAYFKLEVKDIDFWMNEAKKMIKQQINQVSIKKSVVGSRDELFRGESRNNQQKKIEVVQLNNSNQENRKHKVNVSKSNEEAKKTKLAIMKKTRCPRMEFKPDNPQGKNIGNLRDECPLEKKVDCVSFQVHRELKKSFESSEFSRDEARSKDAKLKINDQLKILLESETLKIYSCLDNALKKLENEAKQLSILRKKKVLAEARYNTDVGILSISSFEAENQELGELSSKLSVNAKLKDLTCRLDVIRNLVHSENNALKEEIVDNLAASGANSKVHMLREKDIAEKRLRSLEKEDKLVTPKKDTLWDKVSKMLPKLQAVKYFKTMMGVTLEKTPKDENSQERTLEGEMLNGTKIS